MGKLDLSPGVLAAAVAAILVSLILFRRSSSNNKMPLPPSPEGSLPVLGHTLTMAKSKYPWRTFYEMSKKLDNPPIMYLKLGTAHTIVVNSVRAQVDLLEKKGAIYSDRPRLIVPTEIISNNRRVVLTYYGDRWRKMRKFLHSVLHDKVAATYEPTQERESKVLLLNLLRDPAEFHDHIMLFSSNIILQTTFNRRAETAKDQDIQDLLEDVGTWMLSANPGHHVVHDFPMLHHLPSALAPWKAHGKRLHELEMKLYASLASTVKRQMENNQKPDVIMRYLYEGQKEFELDDEDVLYLAGTLFEAGADTTTSTLISLFLACAMDPNLSKKIQAEVDAHTSPTSIPTMDEARELQYVEAVALELLRWRPAVPAAVPHKVMEDDTYNGWHIPAGSTVIGNSWGIHRDPEYFKDGDDFRPERYMPGPERDKIFSALSKGHTSFGHGRRVCPGNSLAGRSLAVAITQIFWAFDVVADPTAGPVDPYDFTSGFVWHARPFSVSIKPRSAQKVEIIKHEAGLALEEMKEALG